MTAMYAAPAASALPTPQKDLLTRGREMRAFQRIATWLGPFRSADELPPNVERTHVRFDRGHHAMPCEALVYRPIGEVPFGAYLIAHGLNPRGPFDPRCDRFARVLAHAGFVVMCPIMDDFKALLVRPGVAKQFEATAVRLLESEDLPHGVAPGIFGISFGSMPAVAAAGSRRLTHRIGSLLLFGGYAEFHETLRFALGLHPDGSERKSETGEVDETCLPAVYLNLIHVLHPALAGRDLAAVEGALRAFVAKTWGNPKMKDPRNSRPVARAIDAQLSSVQQVIFRTATGLSPGGAAACSRALLRHDPRPLEPHESLARVQCPVYLLHSADDDVISSDQVQSLLKAIPPRVESKVYLTGMYDHGGQTGHLHPLSAGPALVREALTMAGMVQAIIRGGSRSYGSVHRAYGSRQLEAADAP